MVAVPERNGEYNLDDYFQFTPTENFVMHIRWRGMELPSAVHVDRATLSQTYGRFIAEPFERGFGHSIGNSLRRVLLGSLQGSAVTQIKVRGAQHEFTTIPGVLEDVTDIVLNVKSLVVRSHSEATRVIAVERSRAGVITGADVQVDSDVEIINRDHVLATLTDDVPFMMEMVVENGRGYVPATEHSTEDHEIGIIPIDAVFCPITRVRYFVEETRVGQKTNYDKLIVEIWTDGSIHPELALTEGAKILRKHLNPFVQYREIGPGIHSAPRGMGAAGEAQIEGKLNTPISELRLSVRAGNCLESENIRTVRDLVQRNDDQLLEIRNFGETTLNEVKERLTAMGLRLGMRVSSGSPR
jgi:DNA-directed RNA polymerase subunit alpha